MPRYEKHRIAQRRHYEANKDKYKQSRIDRRLRNRSYVANFLDDKSCVKCGESANECLDFHHTDETTKVDTIANMKKHSGLKTIQEEIKKCIILCANCHRKEHYHPLV